MMSCQDSPAPGCYCSDDDHGGEATGAAATDSFLEMLRDYDSTCDLFELVCQGGGTTIRDVQPVPTVSCLSLSPPITMPPPPPHVPELLPGPPSEEEMVAWLYPIVRGEEYVNEPGGDVVASQGQAADDPQVPVKKSSDQSTAMGAASTEKRENDHPTTTEGKCRKDTRSDSSERRKTTGGARRVHYAEIHNLTEKRRRSKINERFKTLQQLVPGCNKSNQASTLDQTIQYMKSLQQQVQAMSVGCGMKPAAAAAVCPVVPTPYMQPPVAVAAGAVAPGMLVGGRVRTGVVLGPPPMAPFAPMLPCPHHHAVMMPSPLIYPAAAPNVDMQLVAATDGPNRPSSSRTI